MKISPLSLIYDLFNTWYTIRGKFTRLNYSRLDLNDEYLMFEVAGIIEQKYNLNDTLKSATRLSKASEEQRFIAPLARYINEVINGGHHQFFWNTNGVYNDLVSHGLHYYNHIDLEANFQKSLVIYKEDRTMHETDHESIREASKKFASSAKKNSYNNFDEVFFESESQLQDTINQQIKTA